MAELPPELTAKPLALIGVTGLDAVNNAIHRAIWDAFTNSRRPDGAPVQFKLLNNAHEFPTVKPKRNSYEWYKLKGILKRNWMNKYLNEVPSVVVIFYDLDWIDPQWNEKKIECSSRVQSLRAALEGRSTKIAVVLVQHSKPVQPGSEDVVTTERATALCNACELPAKSLYVLPHEDHLLRYTSRLEHAFYDLAQNFYHHEYRIVKGHRDQLNKTSHQYLFVRHQFKMGFLNELKQDQQTAHKHYQQAYNNILDIRYTETDILEIKTVASFINYKLCRLMFNMSCPKDAIAQFRAHTDRFKLRTGPKELMFEHHAWMSSQFSTFAELFEQAIRQGLPAVQTQHPGYYYHMAAQHATDRKTSCEELCKNVTSYPDPDPLAGSEKLEFYGQRPWRPGKLNQEQVDTTRETLAIQALQYKEKTTVNHSMIIIGLLGNAISQFKINRCPRMRRRLVVQMADEYYNSRDYGKVLTLLMHMLWDYRGERWPVLLTDVLKKALGAAFLFASIQDYIILALESLGPSNVLSESHQSAIRSNIINILQKKPPNPEPDLPDAEKVSAIEKWMSLLSQNDPFVFTIDDNMATFIEVKARFSQPKYTVNTTVTVEVFIRNLYREIMEFSKLSVTVNSPGYSSEFAVTDANNKPLIFQSNETKTFLCQFQARQQDVGSEIQIRRVSLYLGNDTSCCVILGFTGIGGETNLLERLYPEIQQFRRGLFESIRPVLNAEIRPEESSVNINVKSQSPALLGEWFPITITLSSNESISNAVLTGILQMDGSSDQSTELSLTMTSKQTPVAVEFTSIDKDHSVQQIVYVKAHKVGDRNLVIKVDYSITEQVKCSKELIYTFSVMKPFEVTTQFYTVLFQPLTKGFINDPFIMMSHITCISPWPITILSTSIELGDSIQKEDEEPQESILEGINLSNGEAASEPFCVVPKVGSEQPTSTGVYTIKWKRTNDDSGLETSSSVTLSPLWVEDAVIGLEAKLPAHGWVRMPICVSYFFRNHSDYLITLQLSMEPSDAFVFAGQKQINICILPNDERKIDWIMRPLVAGLVSLPKLLLAVPADEEHKLNKGRLAEVLERSLPSHIYIMSQSQSLDS
ncbi:trafficking protein particle complex subunit 11 [Cephus cinctus]|uniref:Trafficking protein particle complex subunit 11 n=1 Tax=Cephus cinctus TaxID=211228 RepID=A0AAJ7W5E2_CEPCN|nr:trafficking protein particle complex subunit 11 [Cephus cinctus]